MSEIATIYLCFEGILVPRLSDMVSDYVSGTGCSGRSQGFQKSLVEQDRKLFVGQTTFETYMEEVSRLLDREITSEAVLDWITCTPYWDHEAAKLIMELVGKKNYLVCGISRTLLNIWAQNLKPLPMDKVVYSNELHLENYFDSILDEVVRENLESLDTVLWIDPHPFRTARMIRKGGNALIYVDPYRTRTGICDAKGAAGVNWFSDFFNDTPVPGSQKLSGRKRYFPCFFVSCLAIKIFKKERYWVWGKNDRPCFIPRLPINVVKGLKLGVEIRTQLCYLFLCS